MTIDIYCKDSICPICSSQMHIQKDNTRVSRIICKNRCYKIVRIESLNRGYFNFFIFGDDARKTVFDDDTETMKKDKEVTIIKWIENWKKDEKYVMKILTSRDKS